MAHTDGQPPYPVNQVPTLGEWVDRKRGMFEDIQTKQGSAWEVRAVPVLQGRVAGHRFEMSAVIENGEFRLGFSGGGPAEPRHGTNVPAVGDGLSHGFHPVHGLAEPLEGAEFHWVSLTLTVPQGLEASGGGTGPKWLFGVANPSVTRIDLENENDGTVVSVPTFEAPDQSPVRLRTSSYTLSCRATRTARPSNAGA